ncbi:hypothetical protein LJR034_007826 [Caballeronia sp. LjRoot34]|uniref:hypothetical protein n=1 Tax=Caballeronia sp. LjRoot34 TaxID=3342325 RepID=UPI003ECDD190
MVYRNVIRILVIIFLAQFAVNANTQPAESGNHGLLAIGNSITRHGPSSTLGWTGDWGMAASKLGADYVSQLADLLSTASSSGPWRVTRINASDIETKASAYSIQTLAALHPQDYEVIVIELGDNVPKGTEDTFSPVYSNVIKASKPRNGVLACIGTWWTSPAIDKIIEETCRNAGGIYVDISGLSSIPENVARNERQIDNPGVGMHPSDRGMIEIAHRIFDKISKAIGESP